jgi:hypothetical protein
LEVYTEGGIDYCDFSLFFIELVVIVRFSLMVFRIWPMLMKAKDIKASFAVEIIPTDKSIILSLCRSDIGLGMKPGLIEASFVLRRVPSAEEPFGPGGA